MDVILVLPSPYFVILVFKICKNTQKICNKYSEFVPNIQKIFNKYSKNMHGRNTSITESLFCNTSITNMQKYAVSIQKICMPHV